MQYMYNATKTFSNTISKNVLKCHNKTGIVVELIGEISASTMCKKYACSICITVLRIPQTLFLRKVIKHFQSLLVWHVKYSSVPLSYIIIGTESKQMHTHTYAHVNNGPNQDQSICSDWRSAERELDENSSNHRNKSQILHIARIPT